MEVEQSPCIFSKDSQLEMGKPKVKTEDPDLLSACVEKHLPSKLKVELYSTSKFVLVWWGIVANDLEPCPQSNSERETRNHLLLLCRVSWGICSAVIMLAGLLLRC